MPGQAIVFRDVKGSLLTASEVDENFRNLLLYRGGGMRNRLRNPKGLIAQRTTSVAVAAGTDVYTLDGWRLGIAVGCTAAFTVTQHADAPAGAEYDTSIRVTATSADAAVAAGDYVRLYQPAEGYLVRDLLGNPIALQFDVRSAKTGTHCVALTNSGNDRSYVMTYTVNVADTWEKKYLTLPSGLISAGTWNWTSGVGLNVCWTLMAGTTYHTAAGAWQAGSFLATAAQQNVADTVGNVFAIGCPQLERGYEPGALEHRSLSAEWLLNLRYYFDMTTLSAAAWWGGNTTSGSTYYVAYPFPVPMRAAPTFSGTTSTSVNGFGGSANVAASSVAHAVFGNTAGATVNGGYFSAQTKASAEL